VAKFGGDNPVTALPGNRIAYQGFGNMVAITLRRINKIDAQFAAAFEQGIGFRLCEIFTPAATQLPGPYADNGDIELSFAEATVLHRVLHFGYGCYDSQVILRGKRGNTMPSFDVVSELDKQKVTNAVDQSRRVVDNRFDFKGIEAKFERTDNVVTIVAEADFQVQQMLDILSGALHKGGIDIRCMEKGEVELSGKTAKMKVTLREGVSQELAKKIVKMIKDEKMKVQATIQGDQVRVTGKKRDDLQEVIAMLRASKEIDLPLQYQNFRD